MDPSLRVILKGFKADKGRERFILVWPLTMKVKSHSSCDGIARVSMTRERIRFAWLSSCCFLSLNRRQVVPLYTQFDAGRLIESRPAHTHRVRFGD